MTIWDSINSTFSCLFEQLKNAAKGAYNWISDIIKSAFAWVWTKFTNLFKFEIFRSIGDLIIFSLKSTNVLEIIP